MRHILIMLIGAALITGCSRRWTPPPNPNPQSILQEAEADAKAGKYPEALAKQVWFFENALNYDSAEYGVRLSFALSDWVDLGKVYPPALEKLKSVRDKAAVKIRDGKDIRDNFADFESINKELNEDAKTIDLFVWLDSNMPASAKQIFDLVRPSLVKSKQYTLIGKYIQNPFELYDNAVRNYEMNVEAAKDPRLGKQVLDFAQNKFKNETTTLIALLVVTEQKSIAEKIAEDLKKQPSLPKDDEQIQKALSGQVPEPWP